MALKLQTALVALVTTFTFFSADAAARRKLTPGNSVAEEVRNEHSKGNIHPKFTLTGEIAGMSGREFSIHVRETTPAVTPSTTYGTGDGQIHQVGELGYTLLVTDTEAEEDGTIALIAVDKATDNVNGIVQKATGEKMKFVQTKGNPAWAVEAEEFVPPAWACGVSGDAEESVDRRLEDHEGHHHDDYHHHHHGTENSEKALQDIKEGLRGSTVRMGKRRKLQTGDYNYQVDVFIEIDQTLVTKTGSLSNAIAYVNTIFTGANTIYESEIDTHLSVSHIELTNYYDAATGTSDALSKMRTQYSSLGFKYDSMFPGVSGHDLHHALLGKSLGGGIAYIGVLCNTAYGFGLSASLSGGYTSMDNSVVWDMMVTMHEIGHNFSSGHTHSGYTPFVDSCGCTKDGTCTTACPAELPLAKSSTIMSYCHLCSGGYSNMMYTFGGKPIGTTNLNLPEGYTNSNLAGTYNDEPRRVNAKMYSHVSTRGTCTVAPIGPSPPTAQPTSPPTTPPTSPPTPNPTLPPTPSPTSLPTTPPTSNPTLPPTPKPTGPTAAPTSAPTSSPTNPPTPVPTATPTNPPTSSPTILVPCSSFANGGLCKAQTHCSWSGGTCVPISGGVGGVCSATGDICPADPGDCCAGSCKIVKIKGQETPVCE